MWLVLAGALAFAVGLAVLVLALRRGASWAPWGSAATLGAWLAAEVALAFRLQGAGRVYVLVAAGLLALVLIPAVIRLMRVRRAGREPEGSP
jgi:hypothetical protein